MAAKRKQVQPYSYKRLQGKKKAAKDKGGQYKIIKYIIPQEDRTMITTCI